MTEEGWKSIKPENTGERDLMAYITHKGVKKDIGHLHRDIRKSLILK
jgi:hypothetical protein